MLEGLLKDGSVLGDCGLPGSVPFKRKKSANL